MREDYVLIVYLVVAYMAAGIAVAIPFVVASVPRVMGATLPLTPGARLILVPGAVALWPLVLPRWLAAGRPT